MAKVEFKVSPEIDRAAVPLDIVIDGVEVGKIEALIRENGEIRYHAHFSFGGRGHNLLQGMGSTRKAALIAAVADAEKQAADALEDSKLAKAIAPDLVAAIKAVEP